MTYEAYINPTKKRELSFCYRFYPRNIMWSYVTFLLIIGSVVADHHYAWETGKEYHFLIRSRTLTVLDNLANQFSGILMKGDLTVQVKSSDTLQAVVSKTQYAPVHKVLPKGWDSEITDHEFDELPLTGKPFEIKLEHGVIRDVLVDQQVPTWEVNLLKSIVSQLQIDIQGRNMEGNEYQVPNDNEPFGQFKVMEDSVGGKCEVHYHIGPLSEDILLKTPELVPLPNLLKDGRHLVITKNKSYNKCKQQMEYYSGIVDKMSWKSNNELSKSSTSRIVISGVPSRFTIQSSVTTNKISMDSKIHDTYSGAVYSRINLTLSRTSEISNWMSESKNSVSTGNLVYTYNNPFSNQREPRRRSTDRSSLTTLSPENRSLNSSSEENRNNDDSSSSSSSREERDYLQPKPKLDEAPEIPLLPYFIGYKGKNIHKLEKNFSLVATHLIDSIIKKIENFPSDVLAKPSLEIFEEHITLVRLIRTMNISQILELENMVYRYFSNSSHESFTEEGWKLYVKTAWDIFCDAVAHAGTGPALLMIKNWIEWKDFDNNQAAHIISQIPKTALAPTAEYVQTFFEMITDERVRKQRFVNSTAPLSFAELVRYTQSNKSYYPVHSFGRTVSKSDKALFENYISYMATQLREAIQDGDSLRIQTYIMALGNFGHPKILSAFEPYLEGTLPVTKFQRLMMVVSLNRLVENFPRVARSVAYKIYMNVMEAYELRCAAVYIIMKTNPPLNMLQRMAEFTNEDQDNHVNSAVKSNIDALANLKQPELQGLANKASIVRELLNPHIYIENYSRGTIQEVIMASLNIAQTTILQAIRSDDIDMSKGSYFEIHQSYGGFNLPPARISYSISNIRELLDMWYQMPWMVGNEKKLFIEETIEKLGIEAEDPEQIEGNVFMSSLFTSEFYPFDSNTLEEIGKTLMQHISQFKTPQVLKTRNINCVYYYDVTMAVPTESGLPFIYTLTVPKLTRVKGGGHHLADNSSTGAFMELTAAGHIVSNEKIQSRIGFVTPFEHRHYIAGIDINTQFFIPAGLNVKYREKKKLELHILPDEYYKYGTGHVMIHHSVVPYTARHNILSFESLPSDETRLVNTKEPHEIKFGRGNILFVAKSDNIDSEASNKRDFEAFGEIYNVFRNSGAHYRTFDAMFYFRPVQINITYESYMMFDVNSSEATIPAAIDKRPESEARREQFLKEVSKDVNSAISHVYDISVLSDYNIYLVFTLAVTNSHLDNKKQALFYWNVQSANNGDVSFEFCTIGYIRSSSSIPLNFEKAIEEIPKSEFKAEMRFGNCANGDRLRFEGNWTSSDDAKEMAIKSETTEKCRQEVKQGNVWLPNCQKASKLIRQKDHLMMSIDMDSNNIVNSIIERFKPFICKVNAETINDNKNIGIEIKMPDNNDTKIFLRVSETNVSLCLTDDVKEKFTLWKKYLEKDSECKL